MCHNKRQLSISSVLGETQGDDQSVLRETQPIRSVLRETQGTPGISSGRYPGSYPFSKGGRIVTQLPISSVLRETQGDDQSVLREMQPIRSVLRETQGAPGIS
ncbi:hypothetical protein ACE6H2_016211 [Prunus campanulata]